MIQENSQIQHSDATGTIIIIRSFLRQVFYRIRGIGRIGRIGNNVFTVLHEIPSPAFSFLFFFSFLPHANSKE
jgi:hypothetical protein